MDLLILGFSQSGKTSLFNALTHRQAAPGGRSGGSVGVAKVPDARLVPLTEMFKPQRVVPAEIQYIDTPAMGSGRKRGGGVSGELLNLMQQADAFVHVVRAFDDAEDIAAGAPSPEDIVVAMDSGAGLCRPWHPGASFGAAERVPQGRPRHRPRRHRA